MKNTAWMIVVIIVLVVIGGLAAYYLMQSSNGIPAMQSEQGRQPAAPGSSVSAMPTIQASVKSGIGDFLTDGNGMTLYYFANDTVGKSNCTGACATIWPAFYASNMNVGANLNAADFGTITRSDGATQTTYDGWPLYNYSQDAQAGDTNGQGLGGIWFVAAVPFYNILLEDNVSAGVYLADDNGRALYMFANDTPAAAASACTGICSENWLPFDITQAIAVPAALNAGDFKEFTRADGKKQLAYKGYPIYRYSKDVNPGDISGNGMNNIWFLARQQGFVASKSSAKPQIPTIPAAVPQSQVPAAGGTTNQTNY